MPAGQADVTLFEGSSNVSISHSTFNVETAPSQRAGFKGWEKVLSPSAFHNSGERYEPPRCHPRTRKTILEKIMAWIRGEINTEAFVFWLNGSVGVGKSAIGQTIAEICEEGLLLATFFFGRSDPTRNNEKSFITTLAYQIGLNVSRARHHIEQVFDHDPVIHMRSLEMQMKKLVTEPLRRATAEQTNIPPLVVVDGLDECIDPSMRCKILDIIHHSSYSLAATGPCLIFLVGSRSEHEISLKFDSIPLRDITTHHTLGDTADANEDILYFLEDKFQEVKETHLLKHSIPSYGQVRRMSIGSYGQHLASSSMPTS
ncbi:unnamed protein product [Cyclocybe aegerita]|uniref:Nephrocystin 3-like N-terminal domain-containing protein n=1 Tax=Cyclocybe aegerita TaxID=1973307 RepID=A0A8S0WKC6_CYCAE|nr:unnamed protein product [Cyclocybe aegerita]